MIDVSLEISDVSKVYCPENSNVKYIVKTFWCSEEAEVREENELVSVKLPSLPEPEYSKQRQDGEIVLFIEIWYTQERCKPKFVGLAQCSLDELIDHPYLNPAWKYLNIHRILEDYIIGKLYVKISALLYSNEQIYRMNKESKLGSSLFSTKSDPSILNAQDFMRQIPPDLRYRVQEALAHQSCSSTNNNSNNDSPTSDDADGGDTPSKVQTQKSISKKEPSNNKNNTSALYKPAERGEKPSCIVSTTKSPSKAKTISSIDENSPLRCTNTKVKTPQKDRFKSKLWGNAINNNNNSNIVKNKTTPTDKSKSLAPTTTTRVPHAVAHDLLTSPDFPFKIPAVQAVEKKLQFEFPKTPFNSKSKPKGSHFSDSPPLFGYTPYVDSACPHHHDEADSLCYQADVRNQQQQQSAKPRTTTAQPKTSAEELVDFLNDSFNKTYGNKVEEIRMKNKDADLVNQLIPKKDGKVTERKTIKSTPIVKSKQNMVKAKPVEEQEELEDVLSVEDLGHQRNISNHGRMPSSIKMTFAPDSKTKNNNTKTTIPTLNSYVPGMQITKYKPSSSDRSEKLADPFRSPSKRRMAADFGYQIKNQ